MIDDAALELRKVILRLASDAGELGVTHAEVATLIGLRPGAWPMDIPSQWAPDLTVWQETRLRHLEEVFRLLGSVYGVDAGHWLRRDNAATGLTPLKFLGLNGEALRALRDVLRAELDAMR
jgi:hypothetical protein